MNSKNESLILSPDSLEAEIRHFTGRLDIYSRNERRAILKALHWSRKLHEEQKRASGEPYIIHPLRTAELLIDLKMDPPSIQGALLHDVLEDTSVTRDDLSSVHGEDVGKLVDGVTKLDVMDISSKRIHQAATLRKMVWAMVEDLRVIFIKLADKRHNMDTLQYISDPESRRRIAKECLEIYAPMAAKLGMRTLKAELEDLSFKCLQPEDYARIRKYMADKREEDQYYLEKVRGDILRASGRMKIKSLVDIRIKNLYSVYKKMKNQGKDLHEIYDMMGVRILCENSEACYTLLGMIHGLWVPLEGRFKDYIARPKDNGYSSLHTTVLTEGGRSLEIQIRSHAMHETAEYGIAAHWAYKERKSSKHTLPQDPALVSKLKHLQNEGHDDDAGEFLEAINRDVLGNSIIVYTPKGDPVELPEDSTAIDFAYHIHTEIGDHCMGAKVDGSIIALTRPLRSAETISILTSVKAHPHLNWLKHVRSARARSRIRNWLNKHDENIIIDRNIVAHKKNGSSDNFPAPPARTEEEAPETQVLNGSRVGISVGNERNMMIRLGRCCSPIPGDKIIGYISRGRGIVVHKVKCSNLSGINDFEKRRIHVEWETSDSKLIQRFRIHARYTHNLFGEIEGAIRKFKGHLISGSLEETERGDFEGFFAVEMESRDDFKAISKSIEAIPTVLSIQKLQGLQGGL